MSIINFLASDNYIALNRDVIKSVGLNEAVLLCELCGEYRYWESRDELEDGYFYSTIENIEERTTLSRKAQNNAFAKLKELNVVETKVKGQPPKRFIKLNIDMIQNVLMEHFNMSQRDKFICSKWTTKNNIYNKKEKEYIYKRKYIKEKETKNDRNFVSYTKTKATNLDDSEIF